MRLPIKYTLKVMLKISYKPGKWRWLSREVNDTVSIKLGRFLLFCSKRNYCSHSTIRKDLITAMRKIKCAYMSVLPVSTDMEISSKE